MRLSLPFLLIGVSETLALVTLTTTVLVTISTSQTCATGYKSTKRDGAIPTFTVTFPIGIPKLSIIYKNSTPVQTVVQKPSTSTAVVVSTSVTSKINPTVTDTYSTTSTVFTTLTSTSTSTAISTSTDTASTTTSTTMVVPTPLGYISIQESSGETNFDASAPKARSVSRPRGSLAYRGQFEARGSSFFFATYPFSVSCTKFVQTVYIVEIIKVNPTSTTTLDPRPSTVISTSTYVSTSTLVPRASSTKKFSFISTLSASVTVVESTTTQSTTTVTVAAVATKYAVCDNYSLGPRLSSGNYLFNFAAVDPSATVQYPTVSSAYDCCAACFDTPNCQAVGYASTIGVCIVVVGTTCPAGQPLAGYFSETTGPNQYHVISVNGPCGSLNSVGV